MSWAVTAGRWWRGRAGAARPVTFVVTPLVLLATLSPSSARRMTCPETAADDVAPCIASGTSLTLRLAHDVGGGAARDGASVRASVVAPVIVSGRIAIAPGTPAWGTWSVGDRGHDGRPTLRLTFDSLASAGGSIPIALRITGVDNAWESVDSAGHVAGAPAQGVLQSRTSWLSLLLAAIHPLAGAALFGESRAHAYERRRPIHLAAGTDLFAVVDEPAQLRDWSAAVAPPAVPTLAQFATDLPTWPVRVGPSVTAGSGDPFNVAIAGDSASVVAAFLAAGWDVPERMSVHADLITFIRAAERRGYTHQPVSLQELSGQKPSFVFQRVGNTFAKRHHVRLWRWPVADTAGQAPLYLAAATHDVGITFDAGARRFAHRIDPAIDEEREKVVNDLWFAGCLAGRSSLLRPMPDSTTVNQGRDLVITDGRMAIISLRSGCVADPSR